MSPLELSGAEDIDLGTPEVEKPEVVDLVNNVLIKPGERKKFEMIPHHHPSKMPEIPEGFKLICILTGFNGETQGLEACSDTDVINYDASYSNGVESKSIDWYLEKI